MAAPRRAAASSAEDGGACSFGRGVDMMVLFALSCGGVVQGGRGEKGGSWSVVSNICLLT
jgi:hypothetical protein